MPRKILQVLLCPLVVVLLLVQPADATIFEWLFGTRSSDVCEPASPPEDTRRPSSETDDDLFWYDSYAKAYDKAKSSRKMLLVNFVPTGASRAQQELEATITARPQWQRKLKQFILCKVPAGAQITTGGKPVQLLRHAAFGEMHGHPGIAVVDLASEGKPHYGHVVSAFPFMTSKYYHWQTQHFAAVLDLPPGTITQRTMIWAVRTHPERPASTSGLHDPALADAASSHSRHQASLGVQGHHNWNGRFHRLRRLLGGGLPVEVVAESWPGQTMIDSCVDCVDSWRQSSGHWSAVRSNQSRFGFDIRRGRNGIWYGTGIFVR